MAKGTRQTGQNAATAKTGKVKVAAVKSGGAKRARVRVPRREGTVKVVRNGNGRALPVPAAVLTAVNAGVGTQFEVRAVGDDLLFHRLTDDAPAAPPTAGTGATRVFTPTEVTFLATTPGVALLDDWDF